VQVLSVRFPPLASDCPLAEDGPGRILGLGVPAGFFSFRSRPAPEQPRTPHAPTGHNRDLRAARRPISQTSPVVSGPSPDASRMAMMRRDRRPRRWADRTGAQFPTRHPKFPRVLAASRIFPVPRAAPDTAAAVRWDSGSGTPRTSVSRRRSVRPFAEGARKLLERHAPARSAARRFFEARREFPRPLATRGSVKTLKSRQRGELFSLLPFL
jgi:hypothetical protein